MATKYFVGLADDKWSNNGNWSLSSGGPNDTTKAVAGDDVINQADIDIDTTEECGSFTQSQNKSIAFNGALNISGNFSVTLISSLSGTGSVNVQGDYTMDEFAGGDATNIDFVLDGTGDQNLIWDTGSDGFTITINKASGTVFASADIPEVSVVVRGLGIILDAGSFDGNGFDCNFRELTINAGTFDLGSGSCVMRGDTTLAGGNFISSSDFFAPQSFTVTSGTFDNNGGKVILGRIAGGTMTSNGVIFNDVDFVKSSGGAGGYTFADDINIDGDVFVDNQDGSAYNINASGAFSVLLKGNFLMQDTVGSGLIFGSSLNLILEMVGTASQTITHTGGTFKAALSVDKPSDVVSLASDLIMTGTGQDTLVNAGEVDLKGFKLAINDQLVQTGGLINDSVGGGDIVLGRHVATSGTMTVSLVTLNSTTIGQVFSDSAGYNLNVDKYVFTGDATQTVSQLNTAFEDLEINKPSYRSLSGEMHVDGNYNNIESSAHVSPTSIYVKGNLTSTSTMGTTGNSTDIFIEMIGTNEQTFDSTSNNPFLKINKASGTVTFLRNTILSGGFHVLSGSVDWTTNQVITNFNGNNSVHSVTSGGFSFYSVAMSKAGYSSLVLNDEMFIANDYTIEDTATSFTLNGSPLSVKGDLFILEGTLGGTAQIKMTGNQSATILQPNSDWFNTDLVIEKTSGQVTLSSNLTLPKDFNLDGAIFCTNEFDLTAVNINIDGNATFNKTPSSTLTGTVTGVVNDVDECEKKTNFLIAV